MVAKVAGSVAICFVVTCTTFWVGSIAGAAATGGAVSGQVVDQSGSPIQGIEVYAFDAGTNTIVGESESNSSGDYSEPGLATGSYDLFFFATNTTGSWLSGWYKNATSESAAKAVKVKAPATATANITVYPAGTISGTVTDDSGMPVASVSVAAYVSGTSAPINESTTSAEGTYSIPNLATGSYDISYGPIGLKGSWLSGWYKNATSESDATAVAVTAPETATANIEIQHAATIAGIVTDPEGDPVSDVNVYAYVAGTSTIAWEAVTSATGAFAEKNLPTGSYDLNYFSIGGQWKSGWYEDAKSETDATPIAISAPNRDTVKIVLKPS
jgi:hypothetical protein